MRAFLSRRRVPNLPTGPGWTVDAWKPLPTAGPAPLQIGVWGGQLLNQFPAYYNQPQLHQGVEGLNSSWYTPAQSVVPNFQQTQQRAYNPGPQRNGETFTGPIGPISARALTARVSVAQVRQSGLQAMAWAQGLSGTAPASTGI